MPSSWPQPAVLENCLLHTDDKGAVTDDQEGGSSDTYSHRVLALYKFVSPKISKESLPGLKAELEILCRKHAARGTLLIAEEGINGTICYPFSAEGTTSTATSKDQETNTDDELLSSLQAKFDGSLRIRRSVADRPVFARLKIKIKSEIVTMHWQGDKACEGTDATCSSSCVPCRPTERVGEYVRPKEWNKLLLDPDTLVIDTRNEYEIDVGTFRNAINPHTQSFVEFPDWMKRNLLKEGKANERQDRPTQTPKKIAMFCEHGGIRCEKATNAAMQLVPKDIPVYHLEGGILAYLDEIRKEESLFDGDCYVFDQRVAVTYKNRPSQVFRQKCHACRHPLSNQDLEREDYNHGVSCRYCVGKLTEKQEERFSQRQRQMELALKEGRKHIHDPKEGDQPPVGISTNKKICRR